MEAPVTYVREFISADHFESLWNCIPWVRLDVPRRECWMNDYGLPYTYGSGDFSRTYESLERWIPFVSLIKDMLNEVYESKYDCCFINGYDSGKDHLGWHADDSPEMDHKHPIAVISLGAEREIWFRTSTDLISGRKLYSEPVRQSLESGSLLIMHSYMQETWQHRIPKSSVHNCGPRLSMTFRKLILPVDN